LWFERGTAVSQPSEMIHHEGTKGTKDTKVRAMMLSPTIVGAAIEVHKHLGSGLLESVYEAALNRELSLRGIKVERQVHVPLMYKSLPLDLSVRLDLLVERMVVVEVKSVDRLLPIHRAQVLTYLKLTCHSVGLLINFNVELLRAGVRRILNG
jgi:GxxExxY protein